MLQMCLYFECVTRNLTNGQSQVDCLSKAVPKHREKDGCISFLGNPFKTG